MSVSYTHLDVYKRQGGDRMPRVAYSEEDRERIRMELVAVGLELMAKQGIQHTTVEQIYKKVGISRTFFYSFFATKEDLIVETLYLQQPKIIEQAQRLMADPALSWRDAVKQFLYACCYGEKNGIAVLTIEEQQLIFKRLSKESYQLFRQKPVSYTHLDVYKRQASCRSESRRFLIRFMRSSSVLRFRNSLEAVLVMLIFCSR